MVVKRNPGYWGDRDQKKWQVKDGKGRGAGGQVLSYFGKKQSAINYARRVADRGEKIMSENTQTGQLRTIREGR
jgi:hypothetical protein